VERELTTKNKEIEATGKKVKEIENIKPVSFVREITKNIVQDDDIFYAKQLVKAVLLKQKKSIDVLKDVYYWLLFIGTLFRVQR